MFKRIQEQYITMCKNLEQNIQENLNYICRENNKVIKATSVVNTY